MRAVSFIASHSRMATDPTAIRAALGDLSEAELRALITATNEAPQVAYGLLVWSARGPAGQQTLSDSAGMTLPATNVTKRNLL